MDPSTIIAAGSLALQHHEKITDLFRKLKSLKSQRSVAVDIEAKVANIQVAIEDLAKIQQAQEEIFFVLAARQKLLWVACGAGLLLASTSIVLILFYAS